MDPKRLAEVRSWYQEREAELELHADYWEGYQDGLDRLHEQEPPEPEEKPDGDDTEWIYLPKRSAPSQAR